MTDRGLNQDPVVTARIRHTLAAVAPLGQRHERTVRSHPVPGSAAQLDLALTDHPSAVVLAGGVLSVALDHLTAWKALIDGGTQPTAAHMSLLRGAMETAVLCRWLVDWRVEPTERVQRAVAAQLDDYGQRSRFEALMGLDTAPRTGHARSAVERIEELKAAAAAAGIPVVPMPTMTNLFARFGSPGHEDHRRWYQLVSAYAHGKEWALLLAGFVIEPPEPGNIGAVRGKVSANDDLAAGMTALAVGYVSTALQEFASYKGQPRPPPHDDHIVACE